MATIKQIQFKRSKLPGARPTAAQVAEGELALNLADRMIFTKDAEGNIIDLGFAKGGNIDGDVVHNGNYTQTGNYEITGDINSHGTINTDLLNSVSITANNIISNQGNIVSSADADKSAHYWFKGKEVTDVTRDFNRAVLHAQAQTETTGIVNLQVYNGTNNNNANYNYIFTGDGSFYAENGTFSGSLLSPVVKTATVNTGDKPFGSYTIEDIVTYQGTDPELPINYVYKGRANEGGTIWHQLIDGQVGKDEISWWTGDGPVRKISAIRSVSGKGYGAFTGAIQILPPEYGNTALGDYSIALGDNDTGLKWSEDGVWHLVTNNFKAVTLRQNNLLSNSQIFARFSTDGINSTTAPNLHSMMLIDTSLDGNGSGDGFTHIGRTGTEGEFNHLFRGNGITHISTKRGLMVDTQIQGNNLLLSGGANVIQLNVDGEASSSYIGASIAGRQNVWLIGKASASKSISFINNPIELDASKFSGITLHELGQLHIHAGSNTGFLARFLENRRFEFNGAHWAASSSHTYAGQWNQSAPVTIDFGYVPGGSDYYPGYAIQSLVPEGYPTRFEFGMLRQQPAGQQGDWGKGILRIASFMEEGAKDKQCNFMFSINGEFTSPNKVITPILYANKIGAGTEPVWDNPALAIGDNDTGLVWHSDGRIMLWADNVHTANWNRDQFWTEDGKNIVSYGNIISYNDITQSGAGSIWCRDLNVSSDIRIKKDIVKIENPTEISSKLGGYLYLIEKGLNEDGTQAYEESAGLIAQEVQAVLPRLVKTNIDGEKEILRLNYNGITALNTASINQHTDEIADLKAQIKELKEMLDFLTK